MNEEALMMTVMVIVVIAVFVPMILFYMAQQNTLKAIQPANREMSPGNVWLQLIPIFNLYYQFVVVNRISGSINREMLSRNSESTILPEVSDVPDAQAMRSTGIAYCILFCLGWIPMIGPLLSLAGLVCLIIYWTKLTQFKKRIEGVSPALA